jgi:hypothetical protein
MRSRSIVVAIALGVVVCLSGVLCAQAQEGGKTGAMGEMGEMDQMDKMTEKADMGDMEMMDTPFGGEMDIAFAEALWTAIGGRRNWDMKSDVRPGTSPHGKFLRTYYNVVDIDGVPYHVIVKDNYGGPNVTLEMVKAEPDKYLVAVTPMVQREAGYDSEDNNWFYAKYDATGSLMTTDNGMEMAGRVAKGMSMGCIACHEKAGGGDFIYTND